MPGLFRSHFQSCFLSVTPLCLEPLTYFHTSAAKAPRMAIHLRSAVLTHNIQQFLLTVELKEFYTRSSEYSLGYTNRYSPFAHLVARVHNLLLSVFHRIELRSIRSYNDCSVLLTVPIARGRIYQMLNANCTPF